MAETKEVIKRLKEIRESMVRGMASSYVTTSQVFNWLDTTIVALEDLVKVVDEIGGKIEALGGCCDDKNNKEDSTVPVVGPTPVDRKENK